MDLDTNKINIELLSDRYVGNNFDPVNCKTNIYIGDCVRQLSDILEQINKNLEKIANNTEKDTGVSIPTINAIGNFFKEETRKLKELDSDTIICKQNKDSHVDKNIILD